MTTKRRVFKMQLTLQQAIEQAVTAYLLPIVLERLPGTELPDGALNYERDALFETLFQEVMDNMAVSLKATPFPQMAVPLNAITLLELESSHE